MLLVNTLESKPWAELRQQPRGHTASPSRYRGRPRHVLPVPLILLPWEVMVMVVALVLRGQGSGKRGGGGKCVYTGNKWASLPPTFILIRLFRTYDDTNSSFKLLL